jgi:hypothetical protein
MCMYDDGDGQVTMIRDGKFRMARKAHRCHECRRQIEAGESYHAEAYYFDSKFTEHKTCAHCMVARGWLQDECGGWLYGAIEEDIREHCRSGYAYPVGVHRLAVGMAWKWRRKDGSLMPIPARPMTTHEAREHLKESA